MYTPFLSPSPSPYQCIAKRYNLIYCLSCVYISFDEFHFPLLIAYKKGFSIEITRVEKHEFIQCKWKLIS